MPMAALDDGKLPSIFLTSKASLYLLLVAWKDHAGESVSLQVAVDHMSTAGAGEGS